MEPARVVARAVFAIDEADLPPGKTAQLQITVTERMEKSRHTAIRVALAY